MTAVGSAAGYLRGTLRNSALAGGMTSRRAARNSLNRAGETKYSCRMSVRNRNGLARLATGSFISAFRVARGELILRFSWVSAYHRALWAASLPICRRYRSLEIQFMAPTLEAAGNGEGCGEAAL